MSIFNEILSRITNLSDKSVKNINDELQAALDRLGKFEEEYHNGRGGGKEKAQKDKNFTTTLQNINEDDDKYPETAKPKEKSSDSAKPIAKSSDSAKPSDKSSDSAKTIDKQTDNEKRRVSKKRSKDEVDGISSPEQDKRAKRNASVKAQSIISKQEEREILKELNKEGIAYVNTTEAVNVNLSQKMRRDDTDEQKLRRRKDGNKENDAPPVLAIKIKQEKISLPSEPEPMDTECLPVNVNLKKEPNKDDDAMPPPAAPVPKSRRGVRKEKEVQEKEKEVEDKEEKASSEEGGRRRTTRTRKQTDTMPPPPAPEPVSSGRATRGSLRASARARPGEGEGDLPPPAPRPKRTRGKKKVSESSTEPEKNTTLEVTPVGSPADKPRPKRTRRGRNAEKEKEAEKAEEPQILKETTNTTTAREKETEPEVSEEERLWRPKSPVMKLKYEKRGRGRKPKGIEDSIRSEKEIQNLEETDAPSKPALNETVTVSKNPQMNVTVSLNSMDKTVVLPNGVYDHAPVTPQAVRAINETVVLETCNRETMVLDKQAINDATMVIETGPTANNITDDNSLLTDDGDEHEVRPAHTPPKSVPTQQPTSAVKEKVQQFEELAARTTRTKTRAMAKQEEQPDTQTPPDKMLKPVLTQETLTKMNNMIFNGKTSQVSNSASKPRAIPPKSAQTASMSKVAALLRHKEAAEREKEKEDARKKKEAMLEAKREMHKKKREEKMANAAAAREAAERERKQAMENLTRERMEKQLHADQGKLERLKEVERKKLELARKVAETEERRRQEEITRKQKLQEEQRRADLQRKQLEEAEQMKREAALQAKEIEKKKKEYLEKQKMKLRIESLKLTPKGGCYPPLEPVYMADGFQYLNSDSDSDSAPRKSPPQPAWCTIKAHRLALSVQSLVRAVHVDKLFSVRVHSPDLREIFPNIERGRLKRTSSAVWRTPPQACRLPALPE